MVQIVISDLGTIRLAQSILKGMPAKIKTAVRRASIDTIRAVKAEIPRAINARYDIAKSEVRRQMQLRTVSEDGSMRMGLAVTGRPIPVIRFSVTPSQPPPQAGVPVSQRTPIRITTLRGQTKTGAPNRFLATMPSGHTGVFRRTKGSKSLPISEVKSVLVPELIRTKAIRTPIEKRVTDVFVRAIERNVKASLAKP
jgi:hypothetical protein